MDTFELLLPDVGRPLFLLVRSDGLSRKPTWYCDFAELTADVIPPTFFVAGAWSPEALGGAVVLWSKAIKHGS